MKKFIAVLCVLILQTCAFAQDFFEAGKSAFNKKDYVQAQKLFLKELQTNPENYSCRYYLAHTYVYTDDMVKAKIEYNKIIMFAPNQATKKLAMQSLRNLNQPETTTVKTYEEIGENYYEHIKLSGAYVKWQEFPINVYVQPSLYSNLIKTAFATWQKTSGGLVKFNFVSNINSAQITAKISSDTKVLSDEFTAGNAFVQAKNGIIYKSQIDILENDPKTGEKLSTDIIFSTALHEIGHSLGLQGHSPNSTDLMSAVNSQGKKQITNRDLNTLKMLYR